MVITDPRQIERVALTHVDDVEAQLRGDVLNKAFKRFGYKADAFDHAGPLAKVLARLEITPLNTAQVNTYKAGKEKTWSRDFSFLASAIVFFLVAAPSTLLVKTFMLETAHHFDGPDYFFGAVFCLFALGGCFGISVGAGAIVNSIWPETIYKRYWETFPLSKDERAGYKGYIPVHVLHLANQIADNCSDVSFFVEELQLSAKKVERPLPDPFLVAVRGSEKYYIAVWDEREFEAKL